METPSKGIFDGDASGTRDDVAALLTKDMTIAILHDEQAHRRLFEGFLREYEMEGKA